jgi:hypothetical protein
LNMVPFAKPRAIAPPILPEPIIDILILQIISYIIMFSEEANLDKISQIRTTL